MTDERTDEPLADERAETDVAAHAPGDAPAERAAPRTAARIGRGWPGYLVAAIAGVVVTVAVVVGGGGRLPGGASVPSATPGGGASPSAGPSASPTVAVQVNGAAVGPAGAPVTIEVWADYQCPYCALLAHAIEPALVRDYAMTGKGRVVYRDFAFLGQESVDASVAARCADRQGQFWRYHDLLFASQQGENQGAFARSNLLSLARFGALDETAFRACLDDAAIAAAVASETAQGRSYGIESTPTLRIATATHSELLRGLTDFGSIDAAIERVVAGLPAPTPTARPSASGPSGSAAPSASAVPSGSAAP